jgi:phosphatidylserine decarboxylase
MNNPLQYWDRYNEKICEDQVYADWFIKWCYEKKIGKVFLDYFFSKKKFNILYGLYKTSKFSLKQIQKDIEDYSVDMDLFKRTPFRSYSDFFLREFNDGIRSFPEDDTQMGAFSEGRVLAFNSIEEDHKYPVKGEYLTPELLLGNTQIAKDFIGGPLIIIRLCPIDYHHFHYPVSGKVLERYKLTGNYHSVNVLALKCKADIFVKNEREVTVIENENFGKMAYIEVGAMCVGKIIQNNPKNSTFTKGELKGHFEFGASTVILMGQKEKWIPSDDILNHSGKNIESYIKLGDEIAKLKD